MIVYLVMAYNSAQMDTWVHDVYNNKESALKERDRMNDIMTSHPEETYTKYFISERQVKS